LKSSGALLASSLLPKLASATVPAVPRTNWSGNLTYGTNVLDEPTNTTDVQRVVRAHTHMKALGARHSFNNIADSREEQISLAHLNQIELDTANHTVTVGAGVKYGQLAPYIDSHGYAVHNLASLPHVTVAGACATATHGSGNHNGNLSTAVRAMEVVTANGDVVTFSREKMGDKFPGVVVGLGAFGVITKITLAVIPTFQMTQNVFENLPFSELEHNLETIFGSGYSVSLFTDWQKSRATQVWIKRRYKTGDPFPHETDFYGATAAKHKLHPIASLSAEPCTEQMGVPGPWYERLPHFKMNFTPSAGHELQSEYFVGRDQGYQAIRAVEQLRDKITPHLLVTEFRTIAADDLWASTAYQRPSMTLHFTWKPEWAAVQKILPLIEEKLAPFQPRPHWAKVFTLAPSKIQAQYAKMAEYKALLAEYDPKGKFRNQFLNLNLYGT
jgi:xylitol oxidase